MSMIIIASIIAFLVGFALGVAVGFIPMAFFVAGLADESDIEGQAP